MFANPMMVDASKSFHPLITQAAWFNNTITKDRRRKKPVSHWNSPWFEYFSGFEWLSWSDCFCGWTRSGSPPPPHLIWYFTRRIGCGGGAWFMAMSNSVLLFRYIRTNQLEIRNDWLALILSNSSVHSQFQGKLVKLRKWWFPSWSSISPNLSSSSGYPSQTDIPIPMMAAHSLLSSRLSDGN